MSGKYPNYGFPDVRCPCSFAFLVHVLMWNLQDLDSMPIKKCSTRNFDFHATYKKSHLVNFLATSWRVQIGLYPFVYYFYFSHDEMKSSSKLTCVMPIVFTALAADTAAAATAADLLTVPSPAVDVNPRTWRRSAKARKVLSRSWATFTWNI